MSVMPGNKTGDVISRAAGAVRKQWQDAGTGSQPAELGVGQGEAARTASLSARIDCQVVKTGRRDIQHEQPICQKV